MERPTMGPTAPGTTWAPPHRLPAILAALLLALALVGWSAGWSPDSAQAQDYGLRTTELAIEGMT